MLFRFSNLAVDIQYSLITHYLKFTQRQVFVVVIVLFFAFLFFTLGSLMTHKRQFETLNSRFYSEKHNDNTHEKDLRTVSHSF